ncbi:MAG TPA: signal peptidase I [Candidatus Acidoferrales bacterium]|nr:signal peptidase I [Candidatus Acidoferrales bacterium]
MERPKSVLSELVEVGVLALALYLAISFAVQNVHVIGTSMVPTLEDGDYLIATKLEYRFGSPERGDIIIMRDPYDPSKDFIKRVIALPEERLLIRDGTVFIDGRRLEEPYLPTSPAWTNNANWPGSGAPAALIPANSYFVMGDNRNVSSDSRSFSWVGREKIEARAHLRIWPPNTARLVDSRPRLEAASSS